MQSTISRFLLYMRSAPFFLIFVIFLAGVSVFYSCQEEEFLTGNAVELSYSTDTIYFDTVFTSRGSATRTLKIYNRGDEAVVIDRISISDPGSFFRLNVDGLPGNEQEDVIIWPRDSIYVFAEVTIDPDQPLSVSPFIVSERIRIQTGDEEDIVHLEAWGQNANYFPSKANRNGIALLSCDFNQISWDDPRPYVIYGVLIVDSCTLEIPAGQKVYFHGSLANNQFGIYREGYIFTFPNGRLEVNGTAQQPVVFRTDRLEPAFSTTPGQWPGLRFGSGSRGNRLTHAIVEHTEIGIYADSAASVSLDAVEVRYSSGPGIVGVHADVEALNCLVHSTGGHSYQQVFGGQVRIDYCTFASYGNTSSALFANNFYCYDPPFCSNVGLNPLQLEVRNSILAGNERDEIQLSDASGQPALFQYDLQNSVVRVDELLDEDQFPDFFTHCDPCYELGFNEALFANTNEDDFRLDSLAAVLDYASPIPGIEEDIEGVMRDPLTPDPGCYERMD